MNNFYFDTRQRQADRYNEFSYLWKTDDQEWVNARKKVWLDVHGASAGDPVVRAWGDFYVYGITPPSIIGSDIASGQKVTFDFYKRIYFTPFVEKKEVLRFWELTEVAEPSHSNKRHGDARRASCIRGFPEYDRMVKLVIETLFSDDFFMKKNKYGKLATIKPSDFVIGYTNISEYFNVNSKVKFCYQSLTLDYFLKCVQYCEENDMDHVQENLSRLYTKLLSFSDSDLLEEKVELKNNIIQMAESDDAPRLLFNALREARS